MAELAASGLVGGTGASLAAENNEEAAHLGISSRDTGRRRHERQTTSGWATANTTSDNRSLLPLNCGIFRIFLACFLTVYYLKMGDFLFLL